jgi:hypothetical protein
VGIAGFYFISLVPLIVGGVMVLLNKRVVWWEWLVGVAAGFAVSGIMHAVALVGMTGDVETWSGRVERVVFYPRWVEEYQQMHTRTSTDSDGNTTTEIYYTTEYRTHHEQWATQTTLGEFEVAKPKHDEVLNLFGGSVETKWTHKGGFHSGDHNIYIGHNKTDWLEPVTDTRSWANKIKAAPSVFSFRKVPKGAKVYQWPENPDRFRSDRLLGITGNIDRLAWDQMNARLGPKKRVNLILIGFGTAPREIAEWQQAAWLGGKKNDLVVCFGGSPARPEWASVFGWTESETCKRNLETLVLDHGVSASLLPLIEREVEANFRAKDWKKFDYLTIEPPTWAYVVLVLAMLGSQVGWWIYASRNEHVKDGINPFRTKYEFRR